MPPLILSLSKDKGEGIFAPAHPELVEGQGGKPPLILSLSKDKGERIFAPLILSLWKEAGTTVEGWGCGFRIGAGMTVFTPIPSCSILRQAQAKRVFGLYDFPAGYQERGFPVKMCQHCWPLHSAGLVAKLGRTR